MKRNKTDTDIQSESIYSYFRSQNKETKLDVDNDDLISEGSTGSVLIDGNKQSNYAVNNFEHMINEVLNHSHDITLFSQIEIVFIRTYENELLNSAKKLLLSLYGRSSKWQRLDKYNNNQYGEIAALNDLKEKGFTSNISNDVKLSVKLNLLYNNEIEKVAKKFNIKSKSKRRLDMIETIIKASEIKNDISNFFIKSNSNNVLSLESKINNEVMKILENTVCLNPSIRLIFTKITILYSVTTPEIDGVQHIGQLNQRQIFNLMRIKRSELKMPQYKLTRKHNIFATTKDLEAYIELYELFLRVNFFVDHKRINDALKVFDTIEKGFSELIYTDDSKNELPSVLRQYSVKSLLIRCFSLGVTLLEKSRDYKKAVDILELLLTITNNYSSSKRRGKWFLRICINLNSHLKDRDQYIEWLEKAYNDSSIPDYFKLTFRKRLEKVKPGFTDDLIANANDAPDICDKLMDLDDNLELLDLILNPDSEKINDIFTISANINSNLQDLMREPKFIWYENNQTVYCHVEDYVIRYMKKEKDFTKGIHAETSIFILFYYLLFYDIIYCEIDDVFYTYRQFFPLDIYGKSFRESRKDMIEERLSLLRSDDDVEQVKQILLNNWLNHYGEMGLIQSDWSGLLKDSDEMIGLFHCFGRKLLGGICEYFINQFSFYSSGMPDLVLWNPNTLTYQIIEVKGPGDKLSDKQRVWIKNLQKLGANVSVCNVKGVNRKKI